MAPDGGTSLDTTAKSTVGLSYSTARPWSREIVLSLIQALDLLIIAVLGFGIYQIYLHPEVAHNLNYYLGGTVLAMLVASITFRWYRVYNPDLIFAGQLNFASLLAAWATTVGVLLALTFAFKMTETFSRVWVFSWVISCFASMLVARILVGHQVRRLVSQGRFADRTVIVGAGEQGQRLAAHLADNKGYAVNLLGFIDDRKNRVPDEAHGLSLLGSVSTLIDMIRRDQVDLVLIALPWNAESRLNQLFNRLATTPVRIRLAPDLAGFVFPNRTYSRVGEVPMLHLSDLPIAGWSHVTKTAEDRVLAALFLTLLSPLMLLIALLIKLDSRGPVFFKQNRHGFNNTLFECWKFRTMRHDMADHKGEQLTQRNAPRITRLGAFLRKSSLDELPQLINVLRGDMSLVGPRPHAVSAKAAGRLYEEVIEAYAARHKVKPGITGWAQVNGWRGETDTVDKIKMRIEHDLFYIDNWSVAFDLWILLKTMIVVAKRDNAF